MAGGVDRQIAATKMCLACNKEFQEDIQRCPDDGTALILLKHEDEWIGHTLCDRYDVAELLGKGGMGVVYLARQRVMDRFVAIKMLQAELTQDEISVKRFEQEAKAASCLNHPHLVTLHDYGISPGGQPFLVMEYLEGRSLLEIIKRHGPITATRAAKLFSEAADGLGHAHHQGIVHRDLKPSNILLVDQEGDPEFVKIVDFGLAKLMPWSGKESQHLTKTGEVFGSPIYMSPEQCMGRELRPTSDIYSLGITLFESLTGKPPFKGANSIQTASKHMSEAPPRLSDVRPDLEFSEELEKVVAHTLAKDPQARYQEMAEFRDALLCAVPDSNVSASSEPRSPYSDLDKLGSTSAIPLHKQEQDRLRQSANFLQSIDEEEQAARSAARPKMILMALGAVAAVALAVTGIALFAKKPPGTMTVSGEIFALSADKRHVTLYDDQTKTPYSLTMDPGAMINFPPKDGPEDSILGYSCEAIVDKTARHAFKLIGHAGANELVRSAYRTTQGFLSDVTSEDNSRAMAAMMIPDEKRLERDFPSEQRIRVEAANSLAAGQVDAPAQRAPDSIRIENVDDSGVRLLVSKNAYLINGHGEWRFTVTGGKLAWEDAPPTYTTGH